MMNLMGAESTQDPRMKMLAQMMAEQNQPKAQAVPDDTRLRDREKLSQHMQMLGQHLKKLRKANHALIRHLKFMIARNDQLAAALGACPDCFGADAQCARCQGQGVAGYYAPNPSLFATYIKPCLEKQSMGPTAKPASGTPVH